MRRGFDRGTTFYGPLRTKFKPENNSREFEDIVHLWNPRVRNDRFEDFDGEVQFQEFTISLVRTNSNADLIQTGGSSGVSRAYLPISRGGTITSIKFSGEDGITQSGTNYLTFTGLNLLGAGIGATSVLDTTAHVNTTDTNAAALNGGSNLTAKVMYALALHGTAANAYVNEGDLLEITATASGSGASVDAAFIVVRIATLPWGLKPRVSRIAGAPLIQNQANIANGVLLLQLDATNEAQVVGVDCGDQLTLPATRCPFFACRFKMSAAPSSVQRAVIGLTTAYNATLDNVTQNAWFRIDGSNSTTTIDVRCETDDNTTDRDDQSSGGVTLTADTWYTLTVDLADPGRVKFFVDDNLVATLNAKDLALTHLLQPIILLQKDSGTGIPSISIDWMRWGCNRF